jgi:hypothetical protein
MAPHPEILSGLEQLLSQQPQQPLGLLLHCFLSTSSRGNDWAKQQLWLLHEQLPQKLQVPQCGVEVPSLRALVLLRRFKLKLCKDIGDVRGE